jgi:hypothetical protein
MTKPMGVSPPKKEQELVCVEEFADRTHLDSSTRLQDTVSRMAEDSSSFGEFGGRDIKIIITKKPVHIKHNGWRVELWANAEK